MGIKPESVPVTLERARDQIARADGSDPIVSWAVDPRLSEWRASSIDEETDIDEETERFLASLRSTAV